ncbi:MAG: YifB family Mg chelatase-like AAA ATPase [Clostridia bacterium]|nr:YifB family Mg chelatase-like AAA ATPase [Clostridia bacterium]
MISRIWSTGISGIDGYALSCECFLSGGLPAFDVVGLPDAAVRESRERVRASIKNCGFEFPMRRITVNLAPADTRKAGALYDLPILLSILAAGEQIKADFSETAFIGELSLDGGLRPVNGALPAAIAAGRAGMKRIFVPAENAEEAALAGSVEVIGCKTVTEIVSVIQGFSPAVIAHACEEKTLGSYPVDFSDVKGQESAKRALEIAAAGGHNALLCGPPGSGKSMLAKRIPTILPDMTHEESLAATKIYSVAGLVCREQPLVTLRPFRSPHHTTSAVSLTGGGSDLHPGEVSLAHNGVLFLDELPEFPRQTLDVLRQPLEDGEVVISRATGTVCYPSRFMLIGAMNPCPCGWFGHPSGRCTCSANMVKNYAGRISGPMRDRLDLFVNVPEVTFNEISQRSTAESSASIRERVNKARAIQSQRYKGTGVTCNAYLPAEMSDDVCELGTEETAIVRSAFDRLGLTARSYSRLLKISRTIADLEGSEKIRKHHIAEALRFR